MTKYLTVGPTPQILPIKRGITSTPKVSLRLNSTFFGRKPVHTAHKLTLLLIHYRKNIRG